MVSSKFRDGSNRFKFSQKNSVGYLHLTEGGELYTGLWAGLYTGLSLLEKHSKQFDVLFLKLINESECDFLTMTIKTYLEKKNLD